MSEKKQRQPKKGHKKSQAKQEPSFPVEVVVYDSVMHEKCIAEYRGENKWWFGTRMYKVYHPNFVEPLTEAEKLDGAMGYRWVLKLGKVLGWFDPTEPVPTQAPAKA